MSACSVVLVLLLYFFLNVINFLVELSKNFH